MPYPALNSQQDTLMAYTTFSQTKNDQLKEPMFFGQPVNVARYDQQKYDIFEKLIEKQLSSSGVRKKLTFLATVSITRHCLNTKNTSLSAT